LLCEYLEDPDEATWREAAVGFAASMLAFNPPWSTESIEALRHALRGRNERARGSLRVADVQRDPPKRWAGLDERKHVALLAQIPSAALQQGKLDEVDLTLRLYDDHASRRDEAFEEDWRAFLHAWNLLQFHPRGVEAVSGESLVQAGAIDVDDVPRAIPRRPTTEPPAPPKDEYEALARDYSTDPNIVALATLLRERNLPVPEEPSEDILPLDLDALLVWPDHRVVLVQEPTEHDLNAWKARGFVPVDYSAP